MRPTTANDNVFDFNALLHPGTVFEHPRDVVHHCNLTLAEKRALRSPKVWNWIEGENRAPSLPDRSQAA